MGTVFAHNLVRQLDFFWPKLVTPNNLLFMARIATIPMTVCATMIALYYHVNRPLGATGYLLIVAFDVVLATAIAPLFGAFYCKNPRPNAALASVLTGAIVRITMEFTLPKVSKVNLILMLSTFDYNVFLISFYLHRTRMVLQFSPLNTPSSRILDRLQVPTSLFFSTNQKVNFGILW